MSGKQEAHEQSVREKFSPTASIMPGAGKGRWSALTVQQPHKQAFGKWVMEKSAARFIADAAWRCREPPG